MRRGKLLVLVVWGSVPFFDNITHLDIIAKIVYLFFTLTYYTLYCSCNVTVEPIHTIWEHNHDTNTTMNLTAEMTVLD